MRRVTTLALLFLLILSVSLSITTSAQEPVAHVLFFHSRDCAHCENVAREVLPVLQEKYGSQLRIDYLDISDPTVYKTLLSLEETHEVSPEQAGIPEVFIGQHILIGEVIIRETLDGLIEEYLAAGGVALPWPDVEPDATNEPPEAHTPPIHLAYFHQAGCLECDRVQYDLRLLQNRYPQLTVTSFDVREEATLAEWLGQETGLPQEKRLTAPAVFIEDHALVGEDLNATALEALVARYTTSGAIATWEDWPAKESAGASGIAERFRSFGPTTVVAAGLIDGVNPCAFATIIFFVSYLALMGRKGKEILSVGAAFTMGVFLAYLAVGLGLYKVLEALPIISVLGRWLYGLTALLCLVLAFAGLYDYFQARGGRPEDMRLKLPQCLRQRVNKVIRQRAKGSTLAISALVTGLIVSILELACTGQVYLPTIIFVMGVPGLRAKAFAYLLLYNLLFVLPLLIVFVFVYHGSNSRQLMRVMRQRAGTIKLATTVLLFGMAIWLGASLL